MYVLIKSSIISTFFLHHQLFSISYRGAALFSTEYDKISLILDVLNGNFAYDDSIPSTNFLCEKIDPNMDERKHEGKVLSRNNTINIEKINLKIQLFCLHCFHSSFKHYS